MLGRQCRLCLSHKIRSAPNVSSATRTCSIPTSRHAVFSSSLSSRTPSSRDYATVCNETDLKESPKDDAAIGNNPYTATTHQSASALPCELPFSLAPSIPDSQIGAVDVDGTTRDGDDDLWWGSTGNDTDSRRLRDKYRIEALRNSEYDAPQLMPSSDPPRAPAPFPHLAALASKVSSRQMEGESDDRKLPCRALPVIPLEGDLDLELESRTSARSTITSILLARATGQVRTRVGDSRPFQKKLRSSPWSDRRSLLSAGPSHYYSTMSRVQPAILRPLSSTKRDITSTSCRLARPNPKHVQAPPPPTFVTGHRIPHRTVQLVDPKTNQLLEPAPLQSIRYDKTTHELRLVSDSPPVVKLIDLAEEAEKAKLLEIKLKMNRKTAFEEKEVQISWASADGDLQHKLDIAKGFLERGDRVNLVFAPKASGTPTEISQSRKEDMIAFFESGMQEYGTTWRDRETTKTTDVIYWQAKSDIMKEKKVKVSEAELEKKRLKDEKKEARRRKEEERKLKAAGKQ